MDHGISLGGTEHEIGSPDRMPLLGLEIPIHHMILPSGLSIGGLMFP